MIEPLTPVVELQSRLGRVGSIQAYNPWDSRKSVAHAKHWVATVASLSYGNTEAKNPEKLFQSIVGRGHLSCLEFVPGYPLLDGAIPANSARGCKELFLEGAADDPLWWGTALAEVGSKESPAHAFLVECPLYVRSQWMRHRSFSYLEMSRRYTKGSKVEWTYYGHGIGDRDEDTTPKINEFHAVCEAEYQRRLEAGWPNEIARGCMPVEAMTRFWCSGFDRDWDAFCKLRQDPHAQPEIRVFADFIREQIGDGPF